LRRVASRAIIARTAMAPTRSGERTAFFEFQARNRRATWRLTATYLLVVGGGGILAALGFVGNVFLVLFALAFLPAVLLIGLGFLALLSPATAHLSDPLWTIGTVPLELVGGLPGLVPGDGGLLALSLLLPLASGLAVRAVWLAAGVGDVLLAMGARPPAPGDGEERQLVNVVEEMAIAAGVPAPQVRLLDGDTVNAAAAGRGLDESYVIVGRRLLDEFDRDETQAILAHLIGSIGNGDLGGAAQIHALLYVLELLIVVVLAPFARLPRRIARQWLAFPLWAAVQGREARAARARALIETLREHRARFAIHAGGLAAEGLGRDYFGWLGAVLVRICPPLMALVAFAQAATGFLLIFASVPVALLWRSRRYLADATAVELTRNPTGLHRALHRLGARGAVAPGGERVAHLFVVGPRPERPVRGTFHEREGLLMAMHPSLERRLRRLERMGAVPESARTR
jgi:Zn-dependent protease with chaperone function